MKRILALLFVLMLAFNFSACGDDDNDDEPDVTTYSIQGTVTYDGTALAGVSVTLSGDSSSSTTTDSDGSYTFSSLEAGDYTITPSLTGYVFDPASISTTISTANLMDHDFVATGAYSIEGQVLNGTMPVSNVTVTLISSIVTTSSASSGISVLAASSTTVIASTITDVDGYYTFNGLLAGDYTITATRSGYTFSADIPITIGDADVTNNNFTVSTSDGTYAIGGVVTLSSAGFSPVPMVLTTTTAGATGSTITTNADGSYVFDGLIGLSTDTTPVNAVYTITPTLTGYIFDPVNIDVTINSADVTDNNFSADINAGAAAYLHFNFPDQANFYSNYPDATVDDEANILFSSYTLTEDITYTSGTVDGYALPQFIDQDEVIAETPDPNDVLGTYDARELYTYVVRSNNDGFDNRTKFINNGYYNPDLRWDQFEQGYLLDLNNSAKTFFPQTILDSNDDEYFAKMYNNKYAYDIYMFRKIDVKKPNAAGELVTFEIGATTDSYIDDSAYAAGTSQFTVETLDFGTTYTDVKAISLDQFLTLYVTDSPSSYTYKIVALDGTYKEGWTYANMGNSYYLVDYDLIIQVDSSNNIVSDTTINFPVRIELIGDAVEYDGSANPAPAYAEYN